MHVETVTTSDSSLLRGVRTVVGSPDLLLCVAFVQERGLRLLEKELENRRGRRLRARLLLTTTFQSQAVSDGALGLAQRLGFDVRVLNPSTGTFHPKLYLGSSSDSGTAFVGSANLTGGLATNVEAGVMIRGSPSDPPLADAWRWAEALWNDPRAYGWTSPEVEYRPTVETIEPLLFAGLEREVRADPVFVTLGRAHANRVINLTTTGVWIETDRSRRRRGGPEEVPAWMLNLAWERLRVLGTLSNRELLVDLRVHRSSAVCALLARMPNVVLAPGPGIRLEWAPALPRIQRE